MCKIQCFLIVLLVDILFFLGLFVGFSEERMIAWNFEAGYLGFLFIAIANFFSLKKSIAKKLEGMQDLEIGEKKKRRFSHLVLGAQIFSSWLRILAYILLFLSLFFLMHFEQFVLWAYVCGIGISLFVVVLLQFWNLKKQ